MKSKAHQDLSDIKILEVQGADPIEAEHWAGYLYCNWGLPVPIIAGPLRAVVNMIAAPFLVDPARDQHYPELIVKWFCTLIPLWIYGLLRMDYEAHPYLFALASAVYILTYSEQVEVYILSLHCFVHRRAFVKQYNDIVKMLYVWFIGLAFGVTPETYQAHHIGMHHVRNNGFKDVSTTLPYRRDSLSGVLQYLIRFHITHKAVADALMDLGNRKAVRKFLMGELSWLFIGLTIVYFRPPAAVVFWFTPMLMTRTGMALGNWGQHAFINDEDPFNDYNLSAVIIDSSYNTHAFNDGYHIMHHLYPTAHYTDLPRLFVADLPEMAKHDSIVFSSKRSSEITDWPTITALLVRQRYDILAEHFVDCRAIVENKPRRSKEEIIALLKSRTEKSYDPSQFSDEKKK